MNDRKQPGRLIERKQTPRPSERVMVQCNFSCLFIDRLVEIEVIVKVDL
jgi:hypothetical protein